MTEPIGWAGKTLFYVHGTGVSAARVVRETTTRLYLEAKTDFSSRDAHGNYYVEKPTSGMVECESDDPYLTGLRAWPRYAGWLATDRDTALERAIVSHQRSIDYWRAEAAKLETTISALQAARRQETPALASVRELGVPLVTPPGKDDGDAV